MPLVTLPGERDATGAGPVVAVARRFRWHMVAGAVIVLVCAAGFGIAALVSGRTFHGTGPTGSPVTITGSASGPARLTVFTDRPGVTQECVTNGHDTAFFFFDNLGSEGATASSLQYDGRAWYEAGQFTEGWRAGETVTCPAAAGNRVLLSADGASTWRNYALAVGGGGVLLALAAAVFVVLGRSPGDRRRVG